MGKPIEEGKCRICGCQMVACGVDADPEDDAWSKIDTEEMYPEPYCTKCFMRSLNQYVRREEHRSRRERWKDEYRQKRIERNKLCAYCVDRKRLEGQAWCGPCRYKNRKKLLDVAQVPMQS